MHGRTAKSVVVLVLLLLVTACGSMERAIFGADDKSAGSAEVEPPLIAPVEYEVEVEGELAPELKDLIEKSSALVSERDRPPASAAALSRRAADDVGRIQDVLKSRGYYAGAVVPRIDTDVKPAKVVVEVTPGPQFTLHSLEIDYQPEVPSGEAPRTAADLGLHPGMAAEAEPILDAEKRVIRRLSEQGYPDARIENRRYVADRSAETITGTIVVDTGRLIRFGDLRIDGLKDVEEDYLRRLVSWKPGGIYDVRKVERVRATLVGTGLFESVSVERKDEVAKTDEQPVVITVTERARRTIGVGVSYSTDEEGFGGEVYWEHRNLFGRAESLRVTAEGSLIRQSLDARFQKPNVLRRDQAIVANVAGTRETTDAFDELSVTSFVGIKRKILEHGTITTGPAFIVSRIKQDKETNEYYLIGLSNTFAYDLRNDLLNPTKGLYGTLSLSPYFSVAGTATQFVISDGSLAGYLPIVGEDRVVLAARGRLGSIFGDSRSSVPANMRFYAGGGGSVRGYRFRLIGPLDDHDDPIGGRSVVEIGAEARIKVTDTIGVVPFVDGGQVFEDIYPSFDESPLWAAGLGLRYYTAFGPLRLDVAFPLNPRSVDDPFQFYVSIGQAF